MDLKYYYCECFLVVFLLCVNGSIGYFEDDYDESPSFGRCPWIRNKLKNGRVKIRSRGRIAKFVCDPGYELAGKRFATCVRGQWNNPIPVCVARGCTRVPVITNGRVTEMYRGALLQYDCNPGYTLDGVVAIYCDGRRWSTAPPTCVVTATDPETICDFEDPDLCGWNHDPTHDFDWKRNQFSTPSGHVGTGPLYDHTFGLGKGGFYLYLEASSPRKVNDTSRLFSPVYPPDYSSGCFIFWYHMYGATTGGLRVYIKPESHVFGEVHPAWEMYGDQGNEWRRGNIIIPALHENFQIVIEGIRGTSYIGDSAIDDVKLTTTDCETMKNTTEPVAHTVAESCRGRCREQVESTTCGCNDNCYANDNCCSDYSLLCTTGNDTSIENPDEPIDDELGKTTSPVTVTILTDIITENETKVPVTTHFVSTSTKSTSETTLDSIATTPSMESPSTSTTMTLPVADVTIVRSSSSASISTTLQTASSTTPSTIPTTISTPPTTSSTASSTTSVKTTIETTTLKTTTSSMSIPSTIASTTVTTTTAVPSTIVMITTKSPISTISSTMFPSTISETTFPQTEIPIVSNSSESITFSTFSTESSTILSTLSTRKTYNLRPRSSTTLSTLSATSTSPNSTFESNTSPTYTLSANSSTSTISVTPLSVEETTKTTSWRHNITVPAVFTRRSTTATSTQSLNLSSTMPVSTRTTTTTTTSKPSTRSPTTSTKSYNIPQTAKTTLHIIKTSQNPITLVTSESVENHASKLESTKNSSPPTVAITAIVIVLIICIAGGLVYYLRKQKSKRQSKLSDDSEMRFLSDNEEMEYSDASALDKILIK